MKQLLFHPFRRIAGYSALLIGLVFMAAAALVAYCNGCHFDGALDIHTGLTNPLWSYFFEALVAWLPLVLIFFITAKLFSRSRIRFIDIAGTMAMSRWPMLPAALFCFLPMPLPGQNGNIAAGIIGVLGLLACSIWMVALMYQAYTVSAHLSGKKAIWSFVCALILSEFITKLIAVKLASVYTLNF